MYHIKTGEVIGICSPSHVAKREGYEAIIESIRRKGFMVREAPNLYHDTYGYSATPRERAEDFNLLVADPEVKLILFGGGEGANELLPYIDFEAIKRNPKLICTYSNGTTLLNVIWSRTGLETYYGQNPSLFKQFSAYDEEQFFAHFVSGKVKRHQANSEWLVQSPGRGEGILLGGYCREFALLLGSPYFSYEKTERYLLFLEDHEVFGGVDYVSSMMAYLEQSGFMDRVTGLLFGHYSEPVNEQLLGLLGRIGERYRIPVIYCDDFGHGKNHAILPIGRRGVLDAADQSLSYSEE